MVQQELIPHLVNMHGVQTAPRLTLNCVGISESRVDQFIHNVASQNMQSLRWSTRIEEWHTEVTLHNAPSETLHRCRRALCDEFGVWRVLEGTRDIAEVVVEQLILKNKRVVWAESCTAGLASARIATVPGASHVLWGGSSLYSVSAKEHFGIKTTDIEKYGTVSREVTAAMARAALHNTQRPDGGAPDIAVALTCVAGPDLDERGQAAGSCWIALAAHTGDSRTLFRTLRGSRTAIQRRAVTEALVALLYFLEGDTVISA